MLLYCFSRLASLVSSHFFNFSVVDHQKPREMSPSRFGLISGTCAICDDCGLATGDHNSLDNAPKTVQGKDLNCQMVYVASDSLV